MQKGGKTTLLITILTYYIKKLQKQISPRNPYMSVEHLINTQTHEIAQISFIQSPHNPFQKGHYAT